MSIWYQYDVKAMGEREAIGKFFNLDPETDIHFINEFGFSFGQKNVPGMRLGKLIEQNPDLVFMITVSCDYDTTVYLQRFDKATDKVQQVFVMRNPHDIEYGGIEINKRLLDEYTKEFPTLPAKHFARQEGYEEFRWSMLFDDHNKVAEILNNADQYKDTINPIMMSDIEFDNVEIAEDD